MQDNNNIQQMHDEQRSSQAKPEWECLVERISHALKKEYVTLGHGHIRRWHAWLVIGAMVGFTAGIALVADRSGEFEQSMATQENPDHSVGENASVRPSVQEMLIRKQALAGIPSKILNDPRYRDKLIPRLSLPSSSPTASKTTLAPLSLSLAARRITPDGSQAHVAAMGNSNRWIVFADSREVVIDGTKKSGFENIYRYDLGSETETQFNNSGIDQFLQYERPTSGNRVVWTEENTEGRTFISVSDGTATSSKRIAPGFSPSISGDLVVYVDYRTDQVGGRVDVYMYNLRTTQERRITNDQALQLRPVISGNYIVWQDFREGLANKSSIYLYDLTTNTERRITTSGADAWSPYIDDGLIAWMDKRDGRSSIYLYDLGERLPATMRKQEVRITSSPGEDFYPLISGNLIIFRRDGFNPGIYLYDLSKREEKLIVANSGTEYSVASMPNISGPHIVYTLYENLYTSEYADVYFLDLGFPWLSTVIPSSGPVGARVTLIGADFTPGANTVNFGKGVIPRLVSDGKTLTFIVPAFIYPACRYSIGPCLPPAIQVLPGIYDVSVTNVNGTSNILKFKVIGQ